MVSPAIVLVPNPTATKLCRPATKLKAGTLCSLGIMYTSLHLVYFFFQELHISGWICCFCTYTNHILCLNEQIGTTKGTGGDILILEEAAYCDEGFFYVRFHPKLHVLFSICCVWFISYSTGDSCADFKHWECLPCCYFDTDVRNQLLHKVCVLYLCCVLWCVLTFLVGQVNQDDGSFHWQTVICNAMHWARMWSLQGSRQSTRMRASLAFGALLAECGASQEA